MNDKHISDDNQPAQQGIDDEDDKGMQKSMTDMHEENFGEDEMQKQNDDHTRPAQSNKGDPEEEASGNTDGGGRDLVEHMLIFIFCMCPYVVAINLGMFLRRRSAVRPGQVAKKPALMVAI